MEIILKVSKFAANINNFEANPTKTYRIFFIYFAAIFSDEFYDLCSISRLIRTDWKVHKFASSVNEFAAFSLFSLWFRC